MDNNWLEYLAPIFFFLVWYISKLFSPKEQQEEEEETFAPTREQLEEAERTRQLQEEIRRQVVARQQGRQKPQAAPAEQQNQPYVPPLPEEREVYPSPPPAYEPTPVPRPAVPDFQEQLSRQMAQLQEAEARKEEALKRLGQKLKGRQAALVRKAAPSSRAFPARGFRADIHARLKDPDGLRKAFVFYEILGPPVSVRKGSAAFSPVWEV